MESDKINGTSRGKLDLQLLFSHARLASLLSLCFRDLINNCMSQLLISWPFYNVPPPLGFCPSWI